MFSVRSHVTQMLWFHYSIKDSSIHSILVIYHCKCLQNSENFLQKKKQVVFRVWLYWIPQIIGSKYIIFSMNRINRYSETLSTILSRPISERTQFVFRTYPARCQQRHQLLILKSTQLVLASVLKHPLTVAKTPLCASRRCGVYTEFGNALQKTRGVNKISGEKFLPWEWKEFLLLSKKE